jgi:hypothetical protein
MIRLLPPLRQLFPSSSVELFALGCLVQPRDARQQRRAAGKPVIVESSSGAESDFTSDSDGDVGVRRGGILRSGSGSGSGGSGGGSGGGGGGGDGGGDGATGAGGGAEWHTALFRGVAAEQASRVMRKRQQVLLSLFTKFAPVIVALLFALLLLWSYLWLWWWRSSRCSCSYGGAGAVGSAADACRHCC